MKHLDKELMIVILGMAVCLVIQRLEYESLLEDYITFSQSIDSNSKCDKINQEAKTKDEKWLQLLSSQV